MTQRRDPEQTLALLWRTRQPGSRGPRGSLSLDRIVRAAVEIADAEGLAAVSMRRVAERLKVTTMSLYRHVPGKDDLIDLMFDAASGPPDTSGWPEDWRGGLTAYAHAMWDVLRARPWMLDVPLGGPPLGPNNLAWMEAALSTMDDTGLGGDEMVGVLMVLTGFVMNEARLEISMARAAPRTGVSYEEWGRVYGRMLSKVTGDDRFPTLARIVASGAFDDDRSGPEEDFDYGLSVLLDGVAALVRARTDRQLRGRS